MSSNFADRLTAAIKQKGTPICVGLDPRIEQIPSFIRDVYLAKDGEETPAAVADTFIEFNKGIIDVVADLVPVVKPQFAFYLRYGSQGVRAFEETCAYAQQAGLIVLADAKSNDIGSTAQAYAEGFLGADAPLSCDALTVNAYLGADGIKPFTELCKKNGKGVFVLVKTSNPSSGDLQDRITDGEKMSIHELMAHFVESWGADEMGESGYSSVGAVVGATYPQEAARLREIMPHAYFLVPGYGAQGGGAADVKPCFDSQGGGALVNSSRGIIFAWEKDCKERNYQDSAREAVEEMKKDLASVL
ncbi:orotidine-5'-phosphate decarboxylase [Candidatus Peregrinibacteria bacterium CG_4_9_14_0_2_um_filter_53_11]|nr:MAG: orotidine-5'-phosphate decarboxylase [Candidatus Peregrinibacteria bacterium CG_4_9_14_0_2_um_filter_53_11]